MIITRLQGGLGNQLFQYAAARLASKQQDDQRLRFHTLYYAYVRNRHFVLSQFKTKGRPVSLIEFPLFFLSTVFLTSNQYYPLYRFLFPHRFQTFSERLQYTFDPQVLQLSGDIFMEGFWQSWRYVELVAREMRAELQLQRKLDKRAQVYLDDMRKHTSVFLHVRRGDYLKASGFAICSIEYYRKAIVYMQKKLKLPHFYIFSDDISWAKENFSFLKQKTVIEQCGDEIDELHLMTQANHAIIANSTFSWWGAWLIDSKDKIIISPDTWVDAASCDVREIVPPTWILISPQ
jgi:hypothetical protein